MGGEFAPQLQVQHHQACKMLVNVLGEGADNMVRSLGSTFEPGG